MFRNLARNRANEGAVSALLSPARRERSRAPTSSLGGSNAMVVTYRPSTAPENVGSVGVYGQVDGRLEQRG
jgi:hypothetical protein